MASALQAFITFLLVSVPSIPVQLFKIHADSCQWLEVLQVSPSL